MRFSQGGETVNILLELFLEFAKIGLFTFGGGYAMIAMMESACVERRHWISHEDMMNVTVIAESTPGPIAINCATFVGYQQAGFQGALAATVGIVFPSFLLICLISAFFDAFLEIQAIAHAFQGIKIAVGLLILDAGFTMLQRMQRRVLPRVIAGCSFAALFFAECFARRLSPICLMLTAAAVSLAVFAWEERRRKGGVNHD